MNKKSIIIVAVAVVLAIVGLTWWYQSRPETGQSGQSDSQPNAISLPEAKSTAISAKVLQVQGLEMIVEAQVNELMGGGVMRVNAEQKKILFDLNVKVFRAVASAGGQVTIRDLKLDDIEAGDSLIIHTKDPVGQPVLTAYEIEIK